VLKKVKTLKVLLVSPFYNIPKAWVSYYPKEPLGLEYLASVVREQHKVRILDCVGEYLFRYSFNPDNTIRVGASEKEIERRIRNYSPDLVGVTSMFATQTDCVDSIVNIVKRVDAGIITVVGGNAVSCYPEETLMQNPNIDIVVISEGELTFKKLLDNNVENLEKIDGITYRKKDRIIRNKSAQLIMNLDSIPFPSRDLVPFWNYLKQLHNAKIREKIQILLNWALFSDDRRRPITDKLKSLFRRRQQVKIGYKGNAAIILTSRGCPFNCYFCAVRNVWVASIEYVLSVTCWTNYRCYMINIG